MTSRLLIGSLALSVFALGCTDPLIGKWEGGTSGSRDNEMRIEDDQTGTAELTFSYQGSNFSADFDLQWEESGDEYKIDWECDGNCADLDFDMDCTMKGDDDQLDCDGDGPWSDYDFEWDKVSD